MKHTLEQILKNQVILLEILRRDTSYPGIAEDSEKAIMETGNLLAGQTKMPSEEEIKKTLKLYKDYLIENGWVNSPSGVMGIYESGLNAGLTLSHLEQSVKEDEE